MTIELPPEAQAVGSYRLVDLAATASSTGLSGGACLTSEGSYSTGRTDILSIDDTQVVFWLHGTEASFVSPGTADGTYSTTRCP